MKNQLSIVIIEDVAEDADLIERALKREKIPFHSRRVDTREDFLEALENTTPDIVLCDHALPQFNSLEALKIVKQVKDRVPFILVTGSVSEEFAVSCLQQGADDYILKSNLSRLPSAILHAIDHRNEERERLKAEAEVRQKNLSLSIANEELLKTNKELDNFVYSVSHNLRGPVSSIQGLVSLVKIDKATDVDTYVGMIEEAAGRLEQTIKEILEYSHNNRSEITRENINVSQLVSEMFQSLLAENKSEFSVEVDIDDPFLYTDPQRIETIIRHLLSNAVKYSDPAKPMRRIAVTVRNNESNVWLTISDNGIGIKPDVVPFIFNMFYRGSLLSDGAGLGLYIVKESVERLGGTISFSTLENIGTTFAIKLPKRQMQFKSAC